MVTVPPLTPLTIPVTDPTVAIAVLLLLQVPPVVVSLKVVVAPGHVLGTPVIGPGDGFTVTGAIP